MNVEKYENSIVNEYIKHERKWDGLTEHLDKSLKLIKCNANHRVYKTKSKLYKIQLNDFEYYEHSVKHEYKSLLSLEGVVWFLNPSLSVIDKQWVILEMDFINGNCLLDLIQNNKLKSFPFIKFILVLFKMSLNGVLHPQIRPRHIFIDVKNNIYLIDYGGAKATTVIKALTSNFKLFKISRHSFSYTSLLWITKLVFFNALKLNRKTIHGNSVVINAKNRWFQNLSEQNDRKQNILSASKTYDSQAISTLFDAEKYAYKAVESNEYMSLDYWSFEIGDYSIKGHRSLRLLWYVIKNNVTIKNKKIVDFFCNIGFIGALSSINGASNVVCLDASNDVLHSAKLYSSVFGLNNVVHKSLSFSESSLIDADICFALSHRVDLGNKKHWDVLDKYNEIVYQSDFDESFEFKRLSSNGYNKVKVLMSDFYGCKVIHAIRD